MRVVVVNQGPYLISGQEYNFGIENIIILGSTLPLAADSITSFIFSSG